MRKIMKVAMIAFAVIGLLAGKINAADVDVGKIKIPEEYHNTGEAGVFLSKVWPQKLFVWQGDPVKGTVEILNRGEKEISVGLRVWLTNDMDTVVGEKKQELTIPPKSLKIVPLEWEGGVLARYGHAMAAELSINGKVTASGEEYFGSSMNVWDIGISGHHPEGGQTARPNLTMESLERSVDNFRKAYLNTFEKFFWAPDDFANLTPKEDEWFSGQARYHESREKLKHLGAYGNEIGVLPTTYGKSIGSGSGAQDFIRTNPEMVYGFGGVMSFTPNTEELVKWQIDTEKQGGKYWQSIGWAMYNMNDPAVVQHGISQLIESTKMFGWDGVRFDGHFQARTGKQRVGDKIVDFSADDADRQTAANQKEMKKQLRKAFPRYDFGYNFSDCGFFNRFYGQIRETVELCADGGTIMDEYAAQNSSLDHPYRNWSDWSRLMTEQAEQVHRLGGQLYPILSRDEAISRYQHILSYAAGAHSFYGGISQRTYNRFATRYSGILWNKDMRWIWNPMGIFVIDRSAWWQNNVREIPLGKDRKRMVVHLVNPPAQGSAPETLAAVKETIEREKKRKEIEVQAKKDNKNPDYSALDALPPVSIYPKPANNVRIQLLPNSLGGDWKVDRVLLLDPETSTHTAIKLDTSDPYFWQCTVPEVKFWSVLVFDMSKKIN